MRKAWSIAERRQWWTHFFSGVRVVSDALAVNASIALAYWIRFGSGWFPAPKGVPPVENYLAAMFAVTAVWLLTFRACEMYREQVRPSLPDEFYRVTVAATLATLVLMALTFLYRGFEYSRLTAFFAWGLSIVLTTAGRWTVDALAQSLKRRGVWRTRLALLASPEIVERFQGFDEAQEVVAALSLTSAAPVVERKAHLEQLLQLVNAGQIDQVIVSRALVSTDELLRLLAGCEQ
ncbi:MAG TPA: hypothetical protein EYP85_08095, partial [Armatimonadetes bacterium]|nr:hypothetical protein [Armatimonadota bacterium]